MIPETNLLLGDSGRAPGFRRVCDGCGEMEFDLWQANTQDLCGLSPCAGCPAGVRRQSRFSIVRAVSAQSNGCLRGESAVWVGELLLKLETRNSKLLQSGGFGISQIRSQPKIWDIPKFFVWHIPDRIWDHFGISSCKSFRFWDHRFLNIFFREWFILSQTRQRTQIQGLSSRVVRREQTFSSICEQDPEAGVPNNPGFGLLGWEGSAPRMSYVSLETAKACLMLRCSFPITRSPNAIDTLSIDNLYIGTRDEADET